MPSDRDELIKLGDRMQSEASRVLEWAQRQVHAFNIDYETRQAMNQLDRDLVRWTAERKKDAR